VGGNNKSITLPPQYDSYANILLDIDPRGAPDIVCDARELASLDASQFDAVYCSHNLEHYYRHEVPRVLRGFLHVLKENGFAHIRVPDINAVMRTTIEQGLDIDDVLYQSSVGPIMVVDVLYGHSVEIERSGQDFFAHKTGFTQKSLLKALNVAGFSKVYCTLGNLEINVIALADAPDPAVRALFKLPDDQASAP